MKGPRVLVLLVAFGATAAAADTCESWQPARVFGQPTLQETAYNEVTGNRIFHATGLLIDRMPAPTPSRLYVWDSGNNRILGFDHVGTCVGGPAAGAPCTENSICGASGACTGSLSAPATVVLGQPAASGFGACNRDNTRLAPPTEDTLCAINYPYAISPLEGARGNSLAVDAQHRLYVVDLFNNRVLRYDDPFASDSSADAVFGQPDFHSRLCNRGRSEPDATTLCTGEPDSFYPNHYFSGGLDVTPDGSTLYVADLGNQRVLRIPTATGVADLVIGQADFQSRDDVCSPPYPTNRLCRPNAVRYDPVADRLYVLDGEDVDARIVVFDHPSVNGQDASAVYGPPEGSTFFWSRGITLDPFTPNALWMCDTDNSRVLQYVDGVPERVLSKPDFTTVECAGGLVGDGPYYPQVCAPHGSVGIDRDDSVYLTDNQEQHLERYPGPQIVPGEHGEGVAHSPDALLLDDGSFQGNRIGPQGFANPGYALFVDAQLVVADRQRLLYWNGYASGPVAGGPASGVLAQPDAFGWHDSSITHGWDFTALDYDATRHLLYAVHGEFVTAWNVSGGIVSSEPPVFQIASPLPLRGGGSVTFLASGISVDAATNSAWISDTAGNRILRILNLSNGNRQVDAIVGQPTIDPSECNRGVGRFAPVANGFCIPWQVTRDRLGNLYVVDGTWEGGGNQRVVEYDAASLPSIPSPQRVWPTGGPMPSRVYAKDSFTAIDCDPASDSRPCTPRFVCFEPGTNRMVMNVDGYGNPIDSRSFLYDDPLSAAPAVDPTGRVPIRFNQAAACAFDPSGRLVLLDHTWNRALLVADPPAVGANADGDPSGDACDCAPSDPAAWAIPDEVPALGFDDPATLFWSETSAPGGSNTVVDVFRAQRTGVPPSWTCWVSGVAGTTTQEPQLPAPGATFFYIARARNACGAGPAGVSQPLPACP